MTYRLSPYETNMKTPDHCWIPEEHRGTPFPDNHFRLHFPKTTKGWEGTSVHSAFLRLSCSLPCAQQLPNWLSLGSSSTANRQTLLQRESFHQASERRSELVQVLDRRWREDGENMCTISLFSQFVGDGSCDKNPQTINNDVTHMAGGQNRATLFDHRKSTDGIDYILQ